ncbi:TonB-dependent receptor [Pseudoalteromonas phenolica]|uniref:TonB-dependent receptor n=1 Tax=Pseudoalteromonas phenolica TaxID=161398 RepID=A0A5S3YQP3_9GAMM|nr:TonB-dependent receptor [Pseudoalteromonas phenolica]TMP79166.1 TonB-dependent receptor [Pseudoalteromonas phenolica]
MLKKSLLGAAITAALSFSVAAEQDQPIERITVTANKFSQSIDTALATVNVIDRAQIEQSNIRDLPSLLNNISGVDIVRNGGFGQKVSVFVRGASTKHTLVLVDGVRISDANSGDVSFTNIPVNSIERIEVVKGARAAIYGSDAIAGVFNIITRDAQQHQVSVTTGAHNYFNLQGASKVSQDNLTVGFNFGLERTDGYDVIEKDPEAPIGKDHDRDGYINRNLGVNISYDAEQYGVLSLLGQYSNGHADYDNAWGNDEYEFENYSAKLAWEKKTAQFVHNAALSLSQEENIQTGTEVKDSYSTERLEFEYRTLYTLNQDIQLTAGANLLTEDLGESSASFSESSRDNKAVFVGGFYNDGKWLANLVTRTDDYDFHGRANTYSSAFGIKANKYVTLRLNHGTAFRAPSLTNAFVKDSPWYLPNVDIKPEEATNNEFGLSVTTGAVRYDLAIFSNQIDNLISNQYDADTGKYIPYNVDSATMKGVELSLALSAFGFEHDANLTFLDAKDDTTGADLPRRSDKAFNYTVSKTWDKLDVSLNMQYRSERPSISFYDTTLASYTVFNLSANYTLFDLLELNARVENLTDKSYTTAGSGFAQNGDLLGYVPLGRQLYVGASFQF